MKQYLWIIGLILVILGAFGYALSGSTEKASMWIVSTVLAVTGGVVLIASYFAYHQLSKNHK